MWMSDVEMKVWIRGRPASLTAFAADSMSANCVRASPAITGPSTWRAIPWTASKSPGEAIGKPASITSTPSRASCWAISSFSDAFSEIPGDCSPSRSVVSKISTRSDSLSMVFLAPFGLLLRLLLGFGLRLRGRRALFPPKGEEGEGESRRERHAPQSLVVRRPDVTRSRQGDAAPADESLEGEDIGDDRVGYRLVGHHDHRREAAVVGVLVVGRSTDCGRGDVDAAAAEDTAEVPDHA